MAALCLHYITLRSKQIGSHLTAQLKEREKKWKKLIVFGFYPGCVFHKKRVRNELCLNKVDAQKVSHFFFSFSGPEIKAAGGAPLWTLYPA